MNSVFGFGSPSFTSHFFVIRWNFNVCRIGWHGRIVSWYCLPECSFCLQLRSTLHCHLLVLVCRTGVNICQGKGGFYQPDADYGGSNLLQKSSRWYQPNRLSIHRGGLFNYVYDEESCLTWGPVESSAGAGAFKGLSHLCLILFTFQSEAY